MIVKIQHRRGSYNDYDPSKVLPGELVVTQSDDPNSSDGEAVYIGTKAGKVKQLATSNELDSKIATALQSAIPEFVDEVTQEAQDAADRAEAAAEHLETDTTLTVSGKAADAKKTGDEITALKEDIAQIEPGLSDNAKTALLACFQHVAWIDAHGQDYYDALEESLYEDTIKQITAVFSQGNNVFSATDNLDDLIPFLIVTVTLPDDTTEVISNYKLSGVLSDGASIITVTYKGKTTQFVVNVSSLPSGYTAKNYVLSDGTQYIATSIPETNLQNCWFRYKASRTGNEDRAGHIFSSVNFYTPYLFIYGTDLTTKRLAGQRFGTQIASSNRYAWNVDTDYIVEAYKDGNAIKINETEIIDIVAGSAMSASQNMTILGYQTNAIFRHRGKLYYLKVFNNNNEKIYDFVPCVNSSNVVGLFDLVNNTFYAPTTGTLVAG